MHIMDPAHEYHPEQMEEIEAFLTEHISQEKHRIEQDRIRQWKAAIAAEGHLKKAYKYVVSKKFATIAHIKDSQGSIPTNEGEFVRTLHDFWDTVFSPPGQRSPADTDALIMSRYQRWSQDQLPTEDVSWQMLEESIKHMSPAAAPGPGGWRVTELKGLPKQAWVEMMDMVHLFEREGFPQAWKQLWITLIPKKAHDSMPSAGELRPIAVASAAYRVYSRAKAMTLRPILEEFLDESQWGARPGRSLYQAVSAVASKLEVERDNKQAAWFGISVDFKKCFDSMPYTSIGCILTLAGVDHTVACRIQEMVSQMTRRWRLPGRNLSDEFKVGRGIPQGCSLSVQVANAYMALLAKDLRTAGKPGQVVVSAFCDDVIMMAQSEEILQQLWKKVLIFANTLGMEVSAGKSFALTNHEATHHRWLREGAVANLAVKSSFTYLGATLHSLPPHLDTVDNIQAHSKYDALTQARLARVRALPLSLEQKGVIAASTVMSAICFAPFGWGWPLKKWTAIRSSLVAAVQGSSNPKARTAREILMFIFMKGHCLDPVYARATSAVRWLWYLHMGGAALENLDHIQGMQGQLMLHVRAVGLIPVGRLAWRSETGEKFDLESLSQGSRPALWHQWRVTLRSQLFHELSRRRPVYGGVEDIDRKCSLKFYHTLKDPKDRGCFRLMATNALITKARMHKDPDQGLCDECEVPDTVDHLLWHCPRWASLRTVHWGSCIDMRPMTTQCGLLGSAPTAAEQQVQRQVFSIIRQYLQWRSEHLPWPPPKKERQHGRREQEQHESKDGTRVPTRRVRSKMALTCVPTIGPQPFQGVWQQNGHTGRCVRLHQVWKAVCSTCGAHRIWDKRHLMKTCPQQPKGQRVAPQHGFHKESDENGHWIVCSTCNARSVWHARRRFERNHFCRRDAQDNIVRILSPDRRRHEEVSKGFTRHTPVQIEGMWTCSFCQMSVRRRQSLLQTWCSFPAGADKHMFRG